jgi:hypothetical protein
MFKEEKVTSELGAKTNTAPPDALLSPELHEDATLLHISHRVIMTLEYTVCGRGANLLCFGYTYDAKITEIAPPNDNASFETPEFEELLVLFKTDKSLISILNDEIVKEPSIEMSLLL